MTIESAVMLLSKRGLTGPKARDLIAKGARSRAWRTSHNSILPESKSAAQPPLAAESIDNQITEAVKTRGAMYADGVVASMVDAGMTPDEARSAIAKAVKSGGLEQSGPVIRSVRETTYGAEAAESSDGSGSIERALYELGERLTKAQRDKLPRSAFAWPERRLFPIHDRTHAQIALPRLHALYKRGYLTDGEYRYVRGNVLRAYEKFGLRARAPSQVARRAAETQETQTMKQKGKLTKAQLRDVRMANLRKAWKATGARPSRGHSRETLSEPGRKPSKGKGRHKAASKKHPKVGHRVRHQVYEPAGKGGLTKTGKTQDQLRAERIANLEKAWAARGQQMPAPGAHKARKAARKVAKVPGGRYMSPRTGAIIQIQRVFPHENPAVTLGDAAAGGGGLILGLFISGVADRGIATRTLPGRQEPLYGDEAVKAIRTPPDALRIGAQVGGTLLFGIPAYLLRNKSAPASFLLAGVSGGFLVRFIMQLLTLGEAAAFKAQGAADKTFANRFFADKQAWTQQGAMPALTGGATVTPGGAQFTYNPPVAMAGWPGMVGSPMQMPPGLAQTSYGPVASGQVGCGQGWFGGSGGSCGASRPPCPCGGGNSDHTGAARYVPPMTTGPVAVAGPVNVATQLEPLTPGQVAEVIQMRPEGSLGGYRRRGRVG